MSAFALLAQAAEANNWDDIPFGVFVFVGIAAGTAIAITSIITGIAHATKEREFQHTERMKALEQGISVDELDEERRIRKGVLRLAFGIGVAVPILAVIAATSAVINMRAETSTMTVFLIWTGAAAVGVAGVASGAWLANAAIARLSPRARQGASATSPYPRAYDAPEAAGAR